jgi:hypothetical protein
MKWLSSWLSPAFLVAVCAILGVIWACWPDVVSRQIAKVDGTQIATAGQWGDQFGALSSLLSGITLAGVLLGVALQWRQLRHAEEEIANQRAIQQNEKLEKLLLQMLPIIEKQVELITAVPLEGIHALRDHASRTMNECEVIMHQDGLGLDPLQKERHAFNVLRQSRQWNASACERFLECLSFLVHDLATYRDDAKPVARMLNIAIGPSLMRYSAACIAAGNNSTAKLHWEWFLRMSETFWADDTPNFSHAVLMRISDRK